MTDASDTVVYNWGRERVSVSLVRFRCRCCFGWEYERQPWGLCSRCQDCSPKTTRHIDGSQEGSDA